MLLQSGLILQVLLSVQVLLDLLLPDRVVEPLPLHLNRVLHLATIALVVALVGLTHTALCAHLLLVRVCHCQLSQTHHVQMVIIRDQVMLGRGSNLIPIVHVLIVVQILAPLDQPINILLKLSIVNHLELFVIKRILVKCFQLLLELYRLNSFRFQTLPLFSNDLRILRISVQLAKPLHFLGSLHSLGLLSSHSSRVMERFGFVTRLQVCLVDLSEHFVVDGAPSVVFESHVPTVVVVVLRLVIVNVNGLLASVFLERHVVARSE